MDSLNVVALIGTLERDPTMRCDPDNGTARCSGTLCCEDLGATGSTCRLYVPLEAWGKTAEALGELHAGALMAVRASCAGASTPRRPERRKARWQCWWGRSACWCLHLSPSLHEPRSARVCMLVTGNYRP